MYILATVRDPRRGELAGLRWEYVDLDAKHLSIVETRALVAGTRVRDSTPKTLPSRRRVPLDDALVAVLRDHRERQLEDRLAAGVAWHDGGHVFINEIGQPMHPDHISDRFGKLCKPAVVPVIRLHDTRHTAATMLLTLGVHPRVVQEMLGHANVKITLDTYSHVTATMGDTAGAQISAAVLGG
ncbi:MAG: integrase family protein [Pseudonocardiales bacterium]|nr:integrase family protein [Pseudonocardiales bacterium]